MAPGGNVTFTRVGQVDPTFMADFNIDNVAMLTPGANTHCNPTDPTQACNANAVVHVNVPPPGCPGLAPVANRSACAPRNRMSPGAPRSKEGGRRRRWLTLGAVALVCVHRRRCGICWWRPGAVARTEAGPTAAAQARRARQPSRSISPGQSSAEARPLARARAAVLPACPMPASLAASGGWSEIATTKGAISRYASPGGPQDGTIPATWYGGVSALPVIAEQAGWLEVRLAGPGPTARPAGEAVTQA